MPHRSADPVPHGVQPERDGRLECLECGRWYRSLSQHLRLGEDMSPADYRERHGLAATHALVADGLSQTWREQTTDRHERGDLVSIRERITPEAHAAAGRLGNTVHSETASRPEVRRAHQAGVVTGRTQAHENARAKLADLAREHGYDDWESLIRATRGNSPAVVGRMVGRDPKTIIYWRRKILGATWRTAEGRLQPRRAAAFERLDALFAERGWADLDAALASADGARGVMGIARLLNTSFATLRRWDAWRRRA